MENANAHDAAIERAVTRLHEDGYCIILDLLLAATIAALAETLAPEFAGTPFCEGMFYGERTQRFGRVLTRSSQAAALVAHPVVLEVVKRMLGPWANQIQLNLTQAIVIHPGELAQMPHRDQKRGSHASAPGQHAPRDARCSSRRERWCDPASETDAFDPRSCFIITRRHPLDAKAGVVYDCCQEQRWR
jgi:hypothetical protein